MRIIDQFRAVFMDPIVVAQPEPRIDNGALLESTGLRVRHFHGPTLLGFERSRSFTVAYRDTGNNLEIATAVVHPKDRFNRKTGTQLAVASFMAGNVVCVPKSGYVSGKTADAHSTLTSMFGF